MRPYHWFSMLVCLAFVGCTQSAGPNTGNRTLSDNTGARAIAGTEFGEMVIGEPIVHRNLTIFPISSKAARLDDRFITLDEGLRAGTVKIMEVGAEANAEDLVDEPAPEQASGTESPPNQDDAAIQTAEQSTPLADEAVEAGSNNSPFDAIEQVVVPEFQTQQAEVAGDVNRLLVLNTSGRPLFLMPGEIISGGKQDRTIGQELVIQPNQQPVPIDVFCVEQGPWSSRDVEGAVELLETAVVAYGGSAAVAGEDLEEAAQRANQGQFVASVGQLSKSARLAVQSEKRQDAVWEEVAKVNAKTGNNAATANFSDNYGRQELVAKFEPYLQKCQQAVLDRPQVIGVAVAINGKLEAVDVFESTPLFAKLWPKLLKSYALDATALADEEGADAPCPTDACIAFLKQAEDAQTGDVTTEGGLTQTKRESDHLISFSVTDKTEADAASGLGSAVHASFFAQ